MKPTRESMARADHAPSDRDAIDVHGEAIVAEVRISLENRYERHLPPHPIYDFPNKLVSQSSKKSGSQTT
jgi:hypothetical protein